jgi:transcriptional regulator with XRE-family HTH domain
MIQRALEAISGGVERLATELGLHYNTVWSWKEGRRYPSPENRRKLAEVLEARGEELRRIAEELRREAKE